MDLLKLKYKDEKWFLFLNQMVYRYFDDDVTAIGAQLTYYITLSFFPFLIFFLSLLKFTPLSDAHVLERLLTPLPIETQRILYDLIIEIIDKSRLSLISFGAIASVTSASSGIMSVIRAINKAYDLDELRPFLKLKGLSIIFAVGLYAVLFITFSILVIGEHILKRIFVYYSWPSVVIWKILKVLVPFLIMLLLFSLLYKFAPSIKKGIRIKYLDTLPGAAFAALGWILTSIFFSYYVGRYGSYTRSYGTIGGIMLFLIWIYIICVFVVLGGEVNATMQVINNKDIKIQ